MTFAAGDAIWRGFDHLPPAVKSGDFDRILLRPRSPVLQLLGQELTLSRVGRLAQGAAVFVWAAGAAGVAWSAAKLALFAAALVGGIAVYGGLFVLQATSAFWTVEALEVWNAFTYGGSYAAKFPLTIYRPWFRRFFTTVVPIGCVIYLPALALLDKPDPLGVPRVLRWLSPLAGVAFLALALRVWKLGVGKYTSTGS